jgi:hypothetical protein
VHIYLVAEIQNCCGICNCNVELFNEFFHGKVDEKTELLFRRFEENLFLL